MMSNKEKKLKTAVLVFVWATKGLYLEIGGPTMIDLMLILDANHEKVARAVSATGWGFFPGALMGGAMTDRFSNWKDLIVAVTQTVVAVCVMLMPFMDSVDVLWAIFFIMGTANSFIDIVGQKFILEMWEDKAASPMHALHMGFGLGALSAPLIANPFLAVLSKKPVIFNTTNVTNTADLLTTPAVVTSSFTSWTSSTVTPQLEEASRVQYAFAIISTITLLGAFPFWFYQISRFVKSRKVGKQAEKGQMETSRRPWKELINPATYTGGSMAAGMFILILLFFIYINGVGVEQLFGNFVRTYSVDELGFSKTDASYIDMLYWLSFTVGRFSSAILANWIPIRFLYFSQIILILISSTLLHIFGATSQLSLWIFTSVQGFLVAPLYASCLAFGNTQIEITGLVLMVVDMSTGIGLAFYVWITGYAYDALGPRAVLILLQISGIAVFVFASMFLTFGFIRGNRFDKAAASLSQEDDVKVFPEQKHENKLPIRTTTK